jgi:hypothetical protein
MINGLPVYDVRSGETHELWKTGRNCKNIGLTESEAHNVLDQQFKGISSEQFDEFWEGYHN